MQIAVEGFFRVAFRFQSIELNAAEAATSVASSAAGAGNASTVMSR